MSKHTPGPWFLNMIPEEHVPVVVYFTSVQNGKSYAIAEPFSSGEAHLRNLEDWQEQHANARLVAAAPDLLEACKEALLFFENIKPGTIIQTKNAVTCNPVSFLRKAIAKAEGKDSPA